MCAQCCLAASTSSACIVFAGDTKHLHLYVTTQTSIAAFDVKTSSKVSHPDIVPYATHHLHALTLGVGGRQRQQMSSMACINTSNHEGQAKSCMQCQDSMSQLIQLLYGMLLLFRLQHHYMCIGQASHGCLDSTMTFCLASWVTADVHLCLALPGCALLALWQISRPAPLPSTQ